ncbi:uncharacterized protein LOC131858105 [Cryptomeria japonica]|uniref:uncharacterized protein LOC131858105 n=1 Tax=Cryptomeria japonica TaxID=3369 RepID=UPI0027DA6E5A|nr:uncharacterized protein LOC131858105 [Cryptomeria japonica]
MNVDGASKGNPGLSGYGAIIRYEKGEFIGAVTGQEGFVSNNIAEITALEEGLKWATANGLTKVSTVISYRDCKRTQPTSLSQELADRKVDWLMRIREGTLLSRGSRGKAEVPSAFLDSP